jgi:glycosyltransferase involved in cell wall biosynthesis
MPYLIYDSFNKKMPAIDADAVVVNSRLEYNDAVKFGIDKKKIHLIPVGIDVSLYKKSYEKNNAGKPAQKREENKIKLLFVARISRNRNLELIIKALKILKDKFPNKKIELTIVGREIVNSSTDKAGYIFELKKLSKKLGVDSCVFFIGEMKGNDLIECYKKADIFVYTSLYENFGQPLLEAAATGLPIISTPVGIARELIDKNKTGYFVKYDEKDVSDKIALLFERKKRDEFGKRLRETVRKKYDWKKIILQYCKLYNSLLKKCPSRLSENQYKIKIQTKNNVDINKQ